jgi:hypothetical protein
LTTIDNIVISDKQWYDQIEGVRGTASPKNKCIKELDTKRFEALKFVFMVTLVVVDFNWAKVAGFILMREFAHKNEQLEKLDEL